MHPLSGTRSPNSLCGSRTKPIVVDRADGMYFWDTDGNRYLDGVSSLWVNVHGHNNPVINQAIIDQLGKLDHTTFLGSRTNPASNSRRSY